MPKQPTNDVKHVAVLAFPFATHAAPLLSLVRRLAEVVPQARFSFFSTAESNRKSFGEGEIRSDSIKPYNVWDGLPEDHVLSGDPHQHVELFLMATPGNFKEAMESAVNESGMQISCILTDAFFWFAADMAQELGVPWVAVWTAASRALLLHLETDLLRQKIGFNGPEDKTIDFLPGFSAIRAGDLPSGIISGDLKSVFPTMLYKMGLMLPRATAVASNSFEELEPDAVNTLKARLQNFLSVGPFVITSPGLVTSDPQGCLEWLDKQKPESVLYICFGSVIAPPPHEIIALAQALDETGFPFLWSFRGSPEEKLPKEFLERAKEKGKLVSWTPQLKVLQHPATGAFLTHGGWNSISETIIGCVPVICRPFFGDQQLNTRTVEAVWGIGTGIEDGKISKDGVTKALKLILSTDEGQKMKTKLRSLQGQALDAVQSSGSSTKNFKTLADIVSR